MLTLFLYKTIHFNTRKIRYGKNTFQVYIANTFLKQMLGLMHRDKIGKNEGMLFIFRSSGIYPIWMHNMKFPLDILWLDEKGIVNHIVEDVQPCPSILNCRQYENRSNARYVLELNVGAVKRLGIKNGDELSL